MAQRAAAKEGSERLQGLSDARLKAHARATAVALLKDHVDPDRKVKSMSDFHFALAEALKSAREYPVTAKTTVITFGTFDLFHYGHLRLLERAAQLGDRLVVGVSTDDLSVAKKGRKPVCSQEHRKAIVGALACVDEVFDERSLRAKAWYLRKYKANMLVMGSDWTGAFDRVAERLGCKPVYLERTPGISSSHVIEVIETGK